MVKSELSVQIQSDGYLNSDKNDCLFWYFNAKSVIYRIWKYTIWENHLYWLLDKKKKISHFIYKQFCYKLYQFNQNVQINRIINIMSCWILFLEIEILLNTIMFFQVKYYEHFLKLVNLIKKMFYISKRDFLW